MRSGGSHTKDERRAGEYRGKRDASRPDVLVVQIQRHQDGEHDIADDERDGGTQGLDVLIKGAVLQVSQGDQEKLAWRGREKKKRKRREEGEREAR